MPRGLKVLYDEIFVLRIYFGKTIGARQQVRRLVAGLSVRSLQIGHAPDVGQSDSLTDLTRHRQRVSGEDLHRNAQAPEIGDQLLGVRPRRIIKRHQSEQRGDTRLGTSRHRKRAVSLEGRFAYPRLQRLDFR